MTSDRGRSAESLQIQTFISARHRWILVELYVYKTARIDMVLDTGSPFSAISMNVRDTLLAMGLIAPPGKARHTLDQLTLAGHAIADLPVTVSRRVTEVGAQGILGLNFLSRYRQIHFDVPSLVLTLTPL